MISQLRKPTYVSIQIKNQVFKGRRSEFGFSRFWISDYLIHANEHESPDGAEHFSAAMSAIQQSHPFNRVLFSSFIYKINKFNKSSMRVLVLTDQFLAEFDAKRFKLLKEPTKLDSVSDFYHPPSELRH